MQPKSVFLDFSLVPNLLFGNPRFAKLCFARRGRAETEFRGNPFPNWSLGTRRGLHTLGPARKSHELPPPTFFAHHCIFISRQCLFCSTLTSDAGSSTEFAVRRQGPRPGSPWPGPLPYPVPPPGPTPRPRRTPTRRSVVVSCSTSAEKCPPTVPHTKSYHPRGAD